MRLAVGNSHFPVEQTEAWERFEEAMGRPLWGRYLYEDEGKPVAAIALYRYEMGGQTFLWAKHGPVWLKEQSPEREAHLRRLLRSVVKERDRSVRFIRMHARYRDTDLRELLSTITYDRTYVIDLVPKTPEKMAAVMPKDGRRAVKRAERVAREAGCTISDETGLSREEFDQVYEVLRETAERDGFKPHDAEVYWTMLTSLGEKNARLFVLRKDGVPHAWDLILTSGKDSVAYYGASSNESRTFRGAEALDWWAACTSLRRATAAWTSWAPAPPVSPRSTQWVSTRSATPSTSLRSTVPGTSRSPGSSTPECPPPSACVTHCARGVAHGRN